MIGSYEKWRVQTRNPNSKALCNKTIRLSHLGKPMDFYCITTFIWANYTINFYKNLNAPGPFGWENLGLPGARRWMTRSQKLHLPKNARRCLAINKKTQWKRIHRTEV